MSGVGRGGPHRERPLRVLESFRAPRPTTNPYLRLLLEALRDRGSEVRTFTWRRALLGRYDVLHLHWPEVLVRGSSPARSLLRRTLVVALLLRLAASRALTGRPVVVRTVHNLQPHEPGDGFERALLLAVDRCTTASVHLVAATTADRRWAARPLRVVPHGHYREWYRSTQEDAVRGRLLHFGVIRPYKNVEGLLAAAEGLPAHVELRVAGAPTTPELTSLLTAAGAAGTVSTALHHLTDDELATEVARAELVVLPYAASHNSGAALAALSMDRPVLVPRTPVSTALAAEVGPGWVLTYEGALTTAHLLRALEACRARTSQRPDLSAREWPAAATAHAELFAELLAAPARRRARSARTHSA